MYSSKCQLNNPIHYIIRNRVIEMINDKKYGVRNENKHDLS
jgi:hypothetical protein